MYQDSPTNGHGNARSVARILRTITSGGESGGVWLLRPETIDLVFSEQAHGPDLFLGVPLRWGTAFGLPEPDGRLCGLLRGRRALRGGRAGRGVTRPAGRRSRRRADGPALTRRAPPAGAG